MNCLNIILASLMFISYGILFSQKNEIIPPGTIKINDSLFIDKSPVTNIMYIEYLNSSIVLKKRGYSSYSDFLTSEDKNKEEIYQELVILVDPSSIIKDFYFKDKYLIRKKYYNHNIFKNHPVLNITKEKAREYCLWRSMRVNELWVIKNITSKTNTVKYRLLKEKEFLDAKYLFTHSKKITNFNKDIFKIKSKNISNEKFIIFPINELTMDDKLVNKESNSSFTGFRCICELKK